MVQSLEIESRPLMDKLMEKFGIDTDVGLDHGQRWTLIMETLDGRWGL